MEAYWNGNLFGANKKKIEKYNELCTSRKYHLKKCLSATTRI